MMKLIFSALLLVWTSGFLLAEADTDLVEIARIDPTIQIELKYATADNMAGKVLYPPHFQARLRRPAALQLKGAQEALRPYGLGLKVWDAWRSLSAQEALFAVISDPRFVATPGAQSMHNRGIAVDVTLVDSAGKEVPMPTKFDEMSRRASFFYEGKDPAIARNLDILQKVMSRNGFYACKTEWWHFFSRDWRKYSNIVSPLEKIDPSGRSLTKEGLKHHE